MKERMHTPHDFPRRRRGRSEGRYLYTQGRQEREDIGKFAYYLRYLSIVFITLSKEVSLESIFQVALLSHIFQTPPTGRQIQVLNTKFQLAAIFNHQKLGPTYLYLTLVI